MLVLNQTLTLVQGPPGTGKTQTIIILVWLWVCALGRKLSSKLPGTSWPEEYLAAAQQAAEPDDGPTYTTGRHTPLSASDVVGMVGGTLDSATELNACMAPKLGQARGMVDLRAHADFVPALPAPACDLLLPLSVSGRGPVLVSAYTNVAVDEICARLLALPGFRWDGDVAPMHTVVRVGAAEKMDARLREATVVWQLERDDEYKQWCARVEEEHQADVQRQVDLTALIKYVRRVLQTLKQRQDKAIGRINARALVAPVEHSAEKRALMDRCGYTLPTHMSVERAEEDLARLQRLLEHASRCHVRRVLALKEARRTSEFRILQRASVVVGTCVGVASPQLDGLCFSLVIVDECSQVPEPACLLPISKLAPCSPRDLTGTPMSSATAWCAILSDPAAQTQTNISRYGLHPSERSAGSFARVVLVGDQCQLAPVVPRERMKLLGVHVSLFERLLSTTPHVATALAKDEALRGATDDASGPAFFKYYTNNPNCPTLLHAPSLVPRCAMLRTQYRMHAALAQWISTHIYHRRVESGTHPAHRKCPPGFPWPAAISEALVNPSKAKKHTIGRSIATHLFAFEAWVKQLSPDMSPGRLAQALLYIIRTQPLLARVLPLMERQMPAHVPHRSMADAHSARKHGDVVAMFAECCEDGVVMNHSDRPDTTFARGDVDIIGSDIPLLTAAGAQSSQTPARTCPHLQAQALTRARGSGLRLDVEVASHVLTRMIAQPPIATVWRKTTVKCHPSACGGLVQLLPVVFVDVPFAEDARVHQSSKRNTHEAQLVAHIIASLTGALPVAGDVIHGHIVEVVALAVERAQNAAVSSPRPHLAEDPDEHHLTERVGTAAERAALYHLLAHTWLGAAVAAAQGPRVPASEIGVVTPYAGQVRAVMDALTTLRSAVDAREREIASHDTSLASANGRAAVDTSATTTPVVTGMGASGNTASPSPAAAFDVRSVEVRSVDGFQGREKEVMIVSCVRSNEAGELGFVADIRRLNVAISRAKRGLIIVGNQRTLRHDVMWASYLDTIAAAGGVIPYTALAPWLRAGVALPNFME